MLTRAELCTHRLSARTTSADTTAMAALIFQRRPLRKKMRKKPRGEPARREPTRGEKRGEKRREKREVTRPSEPRRAGTSGSQLVAETADRLDPVRPDLRPQPLHV